MLKIVIPKSEHYDEDSNRFFYYPEEDTTLVLEHSLLSISRWEEKWHIPFLDERQLTSEQTLDYIRCMCVKPTPDQIDFRLLANMSDENAKMINDYIGDPMTATFFNEKNSKSKEKKVVTNELIYYWMTAYQIPFSCEKWHLNRLLTLIKVCNAENEAAQENSKKKGSVTKESAAARRALNQQRRAKLHSRG